MVDRKYNPTEIGMIPEDWDVVKLSDVSDFATAAISTDRFNKEAYITTDNMLQDCMGIIPFVGELLYSRVREYRAGDILLSNIRPYLKKIWLSGVNGGCSTDVLVIRPKADLVDAGYLFSQLSRDSFFQYVTDSATGTKMPRGDKSVIKDYLIALPKFKEEQERISKAVYELDRLILDLNRSIHKKKLIKLGTMQKLLTGEVRVKGLTTPWVEVELRQTGVMKSGGTPSTLVPEYWNGDINWLQSGAVQNCYIYPSAVSQKITELGLSKSAAYLISHDSVLIALTGATCANVGYLTFDSAANQSVVSIEPYPEYSAKFLYQLLLTKRDLILQNRGGSAQGGVTLNQLKGITVTIPRDLEEQVEIAAILSAMDNEIAALEAERDKYKNIKQGMMQKLLTGQIRLPV